MNSSPIVTLPTSKTAEFWATRIGKAHADSVAAIIRTGADLLEAKAALAHGEWGRLTGQTTGKPMLPFGRMTAQRLMMIAEHIALSNSTHVCYLPMSYSTLATLTALPSPIVEQYIADGVIHPELDRKTAEQLVAAWRESTWRKQSPLIEADAPRQAPATPPPPDPQRVSELGQKLQDELAENTRLRAMDAELSEHLRTRQWTDGGWLAVLAHLRGLRGATQVAGLPGKPPAALAQELRDEWAAVLAFFNANME